MPTQTYVTDNLVVIYNIPNEFIALFFSWMKLNAAALLYSFVYYYFVHYNYLFFNRLPYLFV